MDPIRSPIAATSSFHQSAVKQLQQGAIWAHRNGISRRCLLTLLTSTAAIPDSSESRKALLQGEHQLVILPVELLSALEWMYQ
jgi:hypothetical protein